MREGEQGVQSVRLSIEISGVTYSVEVPEVSADLTREAISHVEKAYGVFMERNQMVFSDIVMRRMGMEGRQQASGALFNELRGLRLSIDEFLAHSRGESL